MRGREAAEGYRGANLPFEGGLWDLPEGKISVLAGVGAGTGFGKFLRGRNSIPFWADPRSYAGACLPGNSGGSTPGMIFPESLGSQG